MAESPAKGGLLTVSDHDGVDYECQQGSLIICRIVLEQSRRVIVTD